MIQHGCRALVLAWMALLAAGVSISEKPMLGSVGRLARDGLAAISLRPGMPIFKNSVRERKLVAHCVIVKGVATDGTEHTLYAPECPPRGHQFGTDAYDLLIQRIARKVAGSPVPNGPRAINGREPLDTRRLAALGDYFCHSPLVHDQSFARVVVTQQRITRDISDGSITARPPYDCRFACEPGVVVTPRCDRFDERGGDDWG